MGGSAVLAIVLIAGIIGGNDLIAVASALMLTLQLLAIPSMFKFLHIYANQLGITFLLIGLLLPFANGELGLSTTAKSLLTTRGIVAIAVGAVGAWLAAEGITLLTTKPEVMVGMVLGSVLGVSFLGGIPAGPLVASGLAAIVFRFIR
jgi:uncharacterized membrane protein (DUF441 family)